MVTGRMFHHGCVTRGGHQIHRRWEKTPLQSTSLAHQILIKSVLRANWLSRLQKVNRPQNTNLVCCTHISTIIITRSYSLCMHNFFSIQKLVCFICEEYIQELQVMHNATKMRIISTNNTCCIHACMLSINKPITRIEPWRTVMLVTSFLWTAPDNMRHPNFKNERHLKAVKF